jgi:uncharacterized membrane protein YgdD (TMEM256/DUF423 family)
MHKKFLVAGIIYAGLAVVFGAFGAHGVKKMLDAEAIEVFKTGVQYQFYHAIALIVTAILFSKISAKQINWAGNLFLTGILFFSGSLYAITLCKAMEIAVPKFIFPITPIGGACFIAGWIFLLFAVIKKQAEV